MLIGLCVFRKYNLFHVVVSICQIVLGWSPLAACPLMILLNGYYYLLLVAAKYATEAVMASRSGHASRLANDPPYQAVKATSCAPLTISGSP